MNLQTIKNFFNLNNPKEKEEEEHKKKLEELRDLWLNYEVHYFLYNIHHNHPVSKKVEIFKFLYKFNRETQRKEKKNIKEDTVYILALRKAQTYLSKNMAFWTGEQETGIVINDPIFVDFKEITKKEFDRLNKKPNAKKRR